MITISIMLANIMQGVDNTILNVALPHIQGSLSASLDQIAWALTSYIVCAAIMMPLTGWLAGRFGIKTYLSNLGHRVHARLGTVRRRYEPLASSFSFARCRGWPGPG
jgi:MFS family permease